MSGLETLWVETKQAFDIPLRTPTDPVATPPEFSISSTADTPGTYAAGSWSSSWDSTTKYTTAVTPTMGTGGTLPLIAGTTYDLWVKITLGGEVAQYICATVRAR